MDICYSKIGHVYSPTWKDSELSLFYWMIKCLSLLNSLQDDAWHFGVLLHQPLQESVTNEFIWSTQNQKSIYLPSDFESIFNLGAKQNRYKFLTLSKPTYAYTSSQ
jgi:hypothetical protein